MRTTRQSQSKGKNQKLGSIKNTIRYQFDEPDQSQSSSPQTIKTCITIKDLCAEDKQKIGDLIKKLAEEQEEKSMLLEKLKQQDKQYKSTIKSITKQSLSAKKEKAEAEEKFKESLAIIKTLQLQEELVQQQLLYNHVTKFDSFTQCEIEDKENTVKQSAVSKVEQIQVPKKQSEILQLKQEIEEITHSLKNMQFGDDSILTGLKQDKEIKLSPPRNRTKVDKLLPKPVKSTICDQQNKQPTKLQEKCIQTDAQIEAKKPEVNKVNFLQEFKQFESKLKQQQQQSQHILPVPVNNQVEDVYKVAVDSEESDDDMYLARELLKKKYMRLSNEDVTSEQQFKKKQNNTVRVCEEYEQSPPCNSGDFSLQNYGSELADRISSYGIKQDWNGDDQQISALQAQQYKQTASASQYKQQNTNQGNYKTNTLSFNLTNEFTPQQTNKQSIFSSQNTKKSNNLNDTQQFGSSMLQTPEQLSLQQNYANKYRSEDLDEMDNLISSLNGRSFNKLTHGISQQLEFRADTLTHGPQEQQDEITQNYLLNSSGYQGQQADSSTSSIPKEECQRLIAKYMNLAAEVGECGYQFASDMD